MFHIKEIVSKFCWKWINLERSLHQPYIKVERCSILYVKLLYRNVYYVFDIEGKVLEITNYRRYDKIMYVVNNLIQ